MYYSIIALYNFNKFAQTVQYFDCIAFITLSANTETKLIA